MFIILRYIFDFDFTANVTLAILSEFNFPSKNLIGKDFDGTTVKSGKENVYINIILQPQRFKMAQNGISSAAIFLA